MPIMPKESGHNSKEVLSARVIINTTFGTFPQYEKCWLLLNLRHEIFYLGISGFSKMTQPHQKMSENFQ